MHGNRPELIRHLLDKAASTDSDAERDAFTAKAEHLMALWGVEAAEHVTHRTFTTADIVEKPFHVTGTHRVLLAQHVAAPVAKAISPTATVFQFSGRNYKDTYVVVGLADDIDRINLYVPRIIEQARHAWTTYRTGLTFDTDSDRRAAAKSFFASFGAIVARRARAIFDAESTTGSTLVWTRAKNAINDYFNENGYTVTQRTRRMRTWDPYAAKHGYDAGNRTSIAAADLHDERHAINQRTGS